MLAVNPQPTAPSHALPRDALVDGEMVLTSRRPVVPGLGLSGPPGRTDGVAGVRLAKCSESGLNGSECLHIPVWRPRHDPPTKPHDLQSPTNNRTRSSDHHLTQSVGQNLGLGRHQSVNAAAIHERKARQIYHDC